MPETARELPYQPVLPLFGCTLAGVAADRWFAVSFVTWLVLATVCLGRWWRCGPGARGAGWLVLGAALAAGGAWHHTHWRLFPEDDLGLAATVRLQPIAAIVVAQSTPRRQPAPPPDLMNTVREGEESQFDIRFLAVREGLHWRAASGRAQLRLRGVATDLQVGDTIRCLGLLSKPDSPLNPGEPDFAAYERAERRLCRVQVESPDCLQVVQPGRRWGGRYWLDRLRRRCDANLWRHLSPERAGLAAAVLLGSREQIDPRRTEDYMTTGTIHLLSISGLHVGILAYAFWLLTRVGWLSREKTLGAAIAFVVIYALLTDARPPVVRASVLVVTLCTARLLGKEPLNLNTLAAAGLIVLVLNPSSFFHAGTQLSFLAVATMTGIPYLLGPPRPVDPLDQLLASARPWWWRWLKRRAVGTAQGLLLSTAIWLIALPLVVFRFHLVSPIATVLNPVVCLPMGAALFAGVGVMVCGDLAPPVAAICGVVCDVSLASMEWVIQQALRWRGTHVWLPPPSLAWVLAFYGIAAAWSLFSKLRPPRRWVLAAMCGWLALGGWTIAGPWAREPLQPADQVTCTFIAVGHGTSVLLEMPDGRTLLYDAGRLGTARTGARSIASVLWSRRITHLDAVVISHADADHFNAIPDLLARFSVGRIYVSPVMFRHPSAVLDELVNRIEACGVPVSELVSGDCLTVNGPTRVRVLYPPRAGNGGSDNANSIVLLVEHAGLRLLLPGDLESPGLEELLAADPIPCEIVMAPHHGSAASDPGSFVRWCLPKHVVISGGGSRDPEKAIGLYASGGARIWHTAQAGAVQCLLSPRGWTVQSFRQPVSARSP